MEDKKYLDARFDGIEKLMTANQDNLKEYISAVSSNVTKVREDLQEHKESVDAHGVGATSRGKGEWLSVAAILVAAGAFIRDLFKH